jgi:NADPH-dependent 2,4-dienoyl-CoA reductase/sulfur reductase-like enzyme
LLEQMPWFGGRIALTNNSNFEPLDSSLVGGTSEELIAQLLPDTNKNLLLNTEAFGFYDSQTLMALSNRQTMIQFKAKAFIVACGTYGSNIRVPNSDLPGIFTAEGALILLNKYGVSLGKHGVIIEAGNNADFISKEFDALDLSYERVAQNEILSIDGSSVVRGVSVNRNGIRKFIKADFVVLAHKSTPAYDLAVQNGAAVSYDTNSKQFIVSHDENQKSSNGMFVAGQITGASDFKEIHLQGKLAGNSAVEHIKENQSTLEA